MKMNHNKSKLFEIDVFGGILVTLVVFMVMEKQVDIKGRN